MKWSILIIAVLLAGCSTTVPVKQKFPDVPPLLMEKCPQLETIDQEKVILSDFLKVMTRNYTKYYSCSELVNSWQEWYIQQKKIMDSVSSKK